MTKALHDALAQLSQRVLDGRETASVRLELTDEHLDEQPDELACAIAQDMDERWDD